MPVGRTVQEASGGKKAGGKVSTVSEQGARTLLPYYMDCIHSPTFKSGSLHGGCDVLHKPGGGNWKQAWDVFRQMDTLQIDASRCEAFVDAIAPDMKPQAGLQPFEVQLRPQSTDHDVFLQVQTRSYIPHPAFVALIRGPDSRPHVPDLRCVSNLIARPGYVVYVPFLRESLLERLTLPRRVFSTFRFP